MRGMIFDATSVRQMLAGTKTQTRRIIKPQPNPNWVRPIVDEHGVVHGYCGSGQQGVTARYKKGETVYAKEAYAIYGVFGSTTHYHYKADGAQSLDYKSPLFMPEAISRIKLTIANIRVERAANISEEDCIAEGVWSAELALTSEHNAFLVEWRKRWVEVNGLVSWNSNPWVWVYKFTDVEVKR